jgi:hypothetical protein
LFRPREARTQGGRVVVPSGTYSVIVSGTGFETTNDHGDEGADTYALHLWRGPLLERSVLKDGFTSMD